MDAPLRFMTATELEWRRADGMVLFAAVLPFGSTMSGVLTRGMQVPYPYEVYARPHDGSTDWQRVYQIDPVNRTVARLDL
jgi:hypothetical protein